MSAKSTWTLNRRSSGERHLATPQEFGESDLHADVAQFGGKFQAVQAAFAFDAGLFRAAQSRAQIAKKPRIDPADADFDLFCAAMRARKSDDMSRYCRYFAEKSLHGSCRSGASVAAAAAQRNSPNKALMAAPFGQEQPASVISFQEFLEWERLQPVKHEFFAGSIVAFSGGTMDHSAISRNVLVGIDAAVEPPCQAYGSDAIIETSTRKEQHGLRADVVVTCSAEDAGPAKYLRTPRVIVEVISPSNNDDAWRKKLLEYWNTKSIQQLVLVESESRRVEFFVRGDDGMWQPPVVVLDDGIVTFELGFELSLQAIYRRTSLDRQA